MPQSTAALRQKAEALRALRSPQGSISTSGRPAVALPKRIWAKAPRVCDAGSCTAMELRAGALWVLVRNAAGEEAWAPALRVLSFDARRAWAKEGFG